MAKERNLPQKATLTTSDFIRVVGSDNASYKQGLSSVMSTMNLTMNNQVTTSLESYVASLPNDAHKFVWTTGGDSATVGAPVSGVSTVYEIRKVNASTAEIIADTMPRADQRRFIKKQYDTTWGSWIEMPTRAEVDALTNKAQHTHNSTTSYAFSLPNWTNGNYYHFLMYGSTSASAPFLYIGFINADGTSVVFTAVKSANASYTFTGSFNTSTKVLTITTDTTLWGGMTIIAG